MRKTNLDQVGESGLRRSQGVCHGEELNPVLIKAAGVLPRVHDEPPQSAAARFAPQGQQRFPLRHVEADV